MPRGPRAPALPAARATAPGGPQHLADRPPAHTTLPAAERDSHCPPHVCPLLTGQRGAARGLRPGEDEAMSPACGLGFPVSSSPTRGAPEHAGGPVSACVILAEGGGPGLQCAGTQQQQAAPSTWLPPSGSERRSGKQSVLSPNHGVVPKEIRQSIHGRAPHDPQPSSAALCFLPPDFPDSSACEQQPLPLFSARLQKTLPLQDC